MYGLQSLDSWLYGGNPLTHLEYEKVFEELKRGVDEGYFESLLRDLLLDNPFEAVITVSPEKEHDRRERGGAGEEAFRV